LQAELLKILDRGHHIRGSVEVVHVFRPIDFVVVDTTAGAVHAYALEAIALGFACDGAGLQQLDCEPRVTAGNRQLQQVGGGKGVLDNRVGSIHL
jgi:hypothetical protein